MDVVDVPTQYGLTYPIQKVPGSVWIVVGATRSADCSHIHSLDIHYDADDPIFEFADPKDWPEINASTVEAYNAPHRKSARLALRRMVEIGPDYHNLHNNADRAEAEMTMTRLRRANPGRSVHATVGGFTVGFVPSGEETTQ